MATHANAMTAICTKCPVESSTGFRTAEMSYGDTAPQV